MPHPPEPKQGCLMCDSLYVKANGEMPCWDDVGEARVLRTVTEEGLWQGDDRDLFSFPDLLHIRRSFLEGRLPFPDLCSRCAVRNHGVASSERPASIRVLHVEPSYLCQLSCPQCISPKERLKLKKPPYYLSLRLYEGLLRQLANEGVETIRLVHFEGRGDPLLHKDLGEMVRVTKRYFPAAFTVATSHGNFPYRPWMLECGLDQLRLSIDGAFPESYAKYRVGGRLEVALKLLRDLRDAQRRAPSPMRVEWKYILFEWNDSDEEIAEAQRLADELEVHLRFCLTHTPGKSRRFTDAEGLAAALRTLAPRASVDVTFQAKRSSSDADARLVVAEQVHGLLLRALDDYRRGEREEGLRHLRQALEHDPGIPAMDLEASADPISDHLDQILFRARYPSTLSDLANIAQVEEHWHAAEALYGKYFEHLDGGSSDPAALRALVQLTAGNRLGCSPSDAFERELDPVRLQEAEEALLAVDPGANGAASGASPALAGRTFRSPTTGLLLAQLRFLQSDPASAEALLESYLERVDERARDDAEIDAARRLRQRLERCAAGAETLRDYDLNPHIHPLEAVHGYDGHLVAADGRDYVDFHGGWGVNVLGYGYRRVARAIARQARRFNSVGIPQPLFHDLRRLLLELLPWAQEVRYGKNGSDATAAAVRLCRAITGRERILYRGYHGFHDWYMAATDCEGIPGGLRPLVTTLPELTPAAVDAAFRRHRGEVACLILNPLTWPIPTRDEIREVVDVVHRHRALVVFDEVLTGFRLALGGMQEIWGVAPDLACYGKCIANGMPLSVLAGRERHMLHLPRIHYGMTFEGEAVSMAAALATLRELRDRRVIDALDEKGRRIEELYRRAAAEHGVETRLRGPGPCQHLHFEDQGGLGARELRWLTIQELVRRGIFTLGAFMLCYRHRRRDLRKLAGAFDGALAAVRRALDQGSVEGFLHPEVHRAMDGVRSIYGWRAQATGTAVREARIALATAHDHLQTGDAAHARQELDAALVHLLDVESDALEAEERPLDRYRERLLAEVRDTAVLSYLANLALSNGERTAAEGFFRRYLELGPEAQDREKVEAVIGELAAVNSGRSEASGATA